MSSVEEKVAWVVVQNVEDYGDDYEHDDIIAVFLLEADADEYCAACEAEYERVITKRMEQTAAAREKGSPMLRRGEKEQWERERFECGMWENMYDKKSPIVHYYVEEVDLDPDWRPKPDE